MLDTVKSYIANFPDIDFNTYYQQYVLDIQDENINLELDSKSITDINKLVSTIQRELGNLQ